MNDAGMTLMTHETRGFCFCGEVHGMPTVGEAAQQKLAGGHMHQKEAHLVYETCWRLMAENPEVEHAFNLLRMLDRETTKGERCAVCSRYDDDYCTENC